MPEFRTQQELVLFNIARARKKINFDELQKLVGESLNRKQIHHALDDLRRRNLIKKDELIYINVKNIEKVNIKTGKRYGIKPILGDNWESNWESEWIAEVKKC